MRFLFLLLICYGIYLLFKKARKTIPPTSKNTSDESMTHKDPVCGMYITREDAVVGNLEGNRIYFCSMECLEKYREQLAQKV